MKGIILNLLERVVVDAHGEDAWDDILDDAGADGAFTALGNYDDAEVHAVVRAVAHHQGTTVGEALRAFGRAAIPLLQDRYDSFFAPPDPVAFVLTLDAVIHAEVVKLYPGATPPRLEFDDIGPGTVTVRYRSQRAMSDLAVGFLEGAADHYGTTVDIDRTVNDEAGTDVTLRCTFGP